MAEVPREDRDYVNLELPYNTGRVFLLTPNHCSDTIKSVLVLYSAVTARSDIPATEFPDYVRLMHQESDHRLDQEYKVSTNLKTLVIGVIVSIACRVYIEGLPQPVSWVARLYYNTNHNRFNNIYPCE